MVKIHQTPPRKILFKSKKGKNLSNVVHECGSPTQAQGKLKSV
jgi:hypothetical protein